MYCTTAEVTFGPVFSSDEEAERFVVWHFEHYGDPRSAPHSELCEGLPERVVEFDRAMELSVLNDRCDRRAAVEHTRNKR